MEKTIIINESMASDIADRLSMTKFKFKSAVKKFLAGILEDPVGTEPDILLSYNRLDRNRLLKTLVDNGIVTKKMIIDDHDAEGNPHTAKMIVRYSVPKKRFNEKLDALFYELYPNELPLD